MKLLLCFVTVMTFINSSSLLSVPLKAETLAEPYGREYWYNSARESITRRLQYIKERKPRAKNIVMVIGDGMSIATATAARILRGQRLGRSGEEGELAWDTFPAVALAKTYNLDAQTGESSACATALMCGVKANYETLGLDAGGRFNNCISSFTSRVSSLVDWAQEAGKSTGIVTTTRITHATPAALYAHSASRYWEDDGKVPPAARVSCKDIALQMVENEPGRNVHVLLGGGRRHFLPKVAKDPEHPTEEGRRLDGRNLIDDWLRDKKRRGLKGQYVWNKSQLNAVRGDDVDHLLGLFEYSHLSFAADRPLGDEADPSLADMTRAALNVLQKNSKGFFLLIEGGRIDHAHHYNNPYRALDETLELETALLAALERVNPAETLLLVTSDHSHVMTMGGNAAPRGNPILGADAKPSDVDGLPYSTLLYGNGPGHGDARMVNASDMNAVHSAAAPRAWASHGGEDVPVYSLGPLATILFTGTVDQSYIPHAIAYVACIGHFAKRCSEADNFTLPQVTTCIAPEVSSVSAAGTGSGARPAHTSGQMVVASSVMADDVIRASTSASSRLLPSAYCLVLTLLFRYNFLVRVSIYCLNRSSWFKHFCFMLFIVK